jgi:hypothetical protein
MEVSLPIPILRPYPLGIGGRRTASAHILTTASGPLRERCSSMSLLDGQRPSMVIPASPLSGIRQRRGTCLKPLAKAGKTLNGSRRALLPLDNL